MCSDGIRNCGRLLSYRKEISQLEEGDVGTLHPVFQLSCHLWITYMEKLGTFFLSVGVLSLSRILPGLSGFVLSVSRLSIHPTMQRRHCRAVPSALHLGGDCEPGQLVGQ